jgi:transcription-repair coupling factor (superfamily II helicase)
MLDFIAGKYDIMVSTTIVENGIDIPNVNTIIINRADSFGLAQLYQLRGRVGRDVRQAYAYLILPPGEAITPQAIKRLEALEEFTELGAGFSIAMRDMEIRGTGDILGRDQHGTISEIGFEMYCRLLEEAIQDLRGENLSEPLWPIEIKLPATQIFPDDYIPIESQRIRFYKDVAAARSLENIDLITEELADRYGTLPQPALNLLNAARLRIASSPWKIDTIRMGVEDTVRIACANHALELATAFAERASAGRKVFNKLRRQGDVIVLSIRETDEEFTSDEILAGLADYVEAIAALRV